MEADNKKKEIIYWNPWSGCRKISEGCKNCYNRTKPIKVDDDYILCKYNKSYFYTPTSKVRKFNQILEKNVMEYRVPSGSIIKVCDSSDFFLEDADYYRKRAWKQIAERKDCLFDISTKRPERFYVNLPETWTQNGWDNVMVNVSIENQMRADERIPKLLDLPLRHRGIEIAPLQDRVDIRRYISTGLIDRVVVAGERYTSSEENIIVCNYEYVNHIFEQCKAYDVSFEFISTGSKLYKDDRLINIKANDEEQLAKFYNLENKNESFNWSKNLKEIENQERIERASEVWSLINKKRG